MIRNIYSNIEDKDVLKRFSEGITCCGIKSEGIEFKIE